MTQHTQNNQATRWFQDFGKLYLQVTVTRKQKDQLSPVSLDEGIELMRQKVLETNSQGKKIIFIGNGGSSGIASHMATDYLKNGNLRAMCFTDGALLTCISNDLGYDQVFAKPLSMLAEAGDLLVAISSSGSSKNILNAVAQARKTKCHVISLSGFKASNPLSGLGDLNFYLPSSAYGFVEIMHLAICHSVLDIICENRSADGK